MLPNASSKTARVAKAENQSGQNARTRFLDVTRWVNLDSKEISPLELIWFAASADACKFTPANQIKDQNELGKKQSLRNKQSEVIY